MYEGEHYRVFEAEGKKFVEFEKQRRIFELAYTDNALRPEWENDNIEKLAQKRDAMLRGEMVDELEGPFARYLTSFSAELYFDQVVPANWRTEIEIKKNE